MKRKFISAILFGALVAVPASTFVSCSDYDDDISSLNNQTNSLSSQLAEQAQALEDALASCKTDIESAQKEAEAAAEAAATAQSTGDAANQAVEEAKQQIEEAKEAITAAQKAGDDAALAAAQAQLDAAEAAAAAAAAQGTADDASLAAAEAKADAAAAKEAAATAKSEAIAEAQSLVEQLRSEIQSSSQGDYVTTETFNTTVQDLINQINAIDESLSTITQVQTEVGTLTTEVNTAKSAISSLETQVEALNLYLDDIKSISSLNSSLSSLSSKVSTVESTISSIQTEMSTLANQADLESTQQDVASIKTTLDNIGDQVSSINSQLLTLQVSRLSSLVFRPDLYIGGIEAIEYPYLYNAVLKGANTTAITGTNYNGETVTIETSPTEWNYVASTENYEGDPVISVNYHMNPSSAVVDFSALSFASRDVDVVTRSSVSGSIATAETDRSGRQVFARNNGILTVGMQVKGSAILNDAEGSASIFALKANIKKSGDVDTTIVSDYAMLNASKIVAKAIAFSNGAQETSCDGKTGKADTKNELWKTALGAIQDTATVKIQYDEYGDEEGFDLKDILCLHYDRTSLLAKNNTEGEAAVAHKVLDYDSLALYGLKFDYELIDYLVGDNETSDSKYAAISEDGVLTTRAVDSNGETKVPDSDTEAAPSIGREPLVRVRVLSEDGKVVLCAFVKFQIVRDLQDKEATKHVFDELTLDQCNATDLKVEWHKISSDILGLVGMSNEEFNALYKLSLTTDGSEAVQYTKKDDSYSRASVFVGNVVEKVESDGTTTNALTWTLTSADQQAIYEAPTNMSNLNAADSTLTIYVRYERKSNPTANAYIYLPLEVSVTKNSSAKIDDSKKILSYWYKMDGSDLTSDDAASLRQAIKLNVKEPQENYTVANYEYSRLLKDLWVSTTGNNFVGLTSTPTYDSYKFYFDPSINDVVVGDYKLSVSYSTVTANATTTRNETAVSKTTANEAYYIVDATKGAYLNTYLYATPVAGGTRTLIARIDKATTPVNTKIVYETNSVAKAVLNELSAQENGFYAYVNICAQTCNTVIPVSNGLFRAYFQRPLNVDDNDGVEFQDAEGGNASSVDVYSMLSFSDWRQVKFTDNNGWLFGYYGVKSVTLQKDDIRTNLTGEMKNLSDVSNAVIVRQTGNSTISINTITAANSENILNKVAACMGQVEITNIQANVRDYQIELPFAVEYDWGTLYVTVTATVKGTLGN